RARARRQRSQVRRRRTHHRAADRRRDGLAPVVRDVRSQAHERVRDPGRDRTQRGGRARGQAARRRAAESVRCADGQHRGSRRVSARPASSAHAALPEDLFLARDLFARATALDPAYAAAYSDLALASLTAYRYGLAEREDALAAAERAVARGLDLDPQLAGLHAAAGLLEQDRGNGAASVAAYRRAIALNPASELAHFGLFNVLGGLARVAEARQTLELALELDPLNGLLNWSMGNVRLGLGDRERAAVHYRRGIEFEPTQPNSYSGLGDVAIVSGRLDEGLRWYLAGLEQDPGQAH